jgi:hypothetical protein
LLANFGPITNGDSLDYHVGYALNLLKTPFDPHPEWLHGRMAQAGEMINAVGFSVNSAVFSAFIQYSGLASLVFLFHSSAKNNDHKDNSDLKLFLALTIVSSPIFLFLAISAKPQLMPTAMSSLGFIILLRTYKEDLTPKTLQTLLLLVISLSCIAATHKASFLISFIILGALSLYRAYRAKQTLPFLLLAILVSIFIFFPIYIDKYQRYHSSILEFFVSPVGGLNQSHLNFIHYLRVYRENSLPFPLYLLFPSSLGNLTTIFGIGALISAIGLVILKKEYRFIQIVLAAYIGLLWIVGQASTRFYLEPYIWTLLLFSVAYSNLPNFRIIRLMKIVLFIQSTLVIGVLCLFIFGVMRSFTLEGREAFLRKNVDGYTLYKWVNTRVPYGEAILLDHRSSALYLKERNVISADSLTHSKHDIQNLTILQKALLKYNVKYLVTRIDSPNFEVLSRCSNDVYAGPEILTSASKNPFNAGGTYQAEILVFDTVTLIKCMSNF